MSAKQPETYAEAADALMGAIRLLGGQSALARLLGVSQPSVARWVRLRKALPGLHVLKVEEATGISRHDLEPTLYPREAGTHSPAAGVARGLEPAR